MNEPTQQPEQPTTQPAAPKKRRRWLRALGALALLLITLFIAPMLPPVQDFARAKIVAAANGALSGRLKIERLSGDVWTHLELHGVELYDARGNLIISAPTVRARYDLLALPGAARLHSLTISDPLVIARLYPDGAANFSLIAPPSPPSDKPTRLPIDLDLSDITVQNGALVFLDERLPAPSADTSADPSAPPQALPADLTARLALASEQLALDAPLVRAARRDETLRALTAPRALDAPAPPRVASIQAINITVNADGFEQLQTAEGTLNLTAEAHADSWSAPVTISVADLYARGPLVPGDFKATLGALVLSPKGSASKSGVNDLSILATLSGDKDNPIPITSLDAKLPAIRVERALLTTIAAGLPVRSGFTIDLTAGLNLNATSLDARLALTEAPGAVKITASADDLLPALLAPDDATLARPAYKASVKVERISPNDVWPLPIPISAEGALDVSGSGIDPLTATIAATATVSDTTIDAAKIESLDLAANLDAGVLSLKTLAIRSPYADLDASGQAQLNGPFDLSAHLKTTPRHQASYTLPDGRAVAQQAVDVTITAEGSLDALAPDPLDKLPQATVTLNADIGQLDAPGVRVQRLRTYRDAADPAAQPISASIALQPDRSRLVRWDLGLAALRLDAPGLSASQLDARTQGQTTISAAAIADRLADPQPLLDALRIDLTARVGSLRAGANSVGATRLEANLSPSTQGIGYTILADTAAIRVPGASIRRVRTTDARGAVAPITGHIRLAPGAIKRPGPHSIASAEASGPLHIEGVTAGAVSVDDVVLTPDLNASPLLNPAGTLAIRLRGLSVALAGPTPKAPTAEDAADVAVAAADTVTSIATNKPVKPEDPKDAAPTAPAAKPSEARTPSSSEARAQGSKARSQSTRFIKIPRADGLVTFAARDKTFSIKLDGDYVRPGATGAGEPLKLAGKGSLDLAGKRADLKGLALLLPGAIWQLGPTKLALYADGGSATNLELHADPVAAGAEIDIMNPPAAHGRLGMIRADGAVRLRGTSNMDAELIGWDVALVRDMVTRLWDAPLPRVRGKLHRIAASLKGTSGAPSMRLVVAADGLFFEEQGPFAVAVDGALDPRGVRLRDTGVMGWGYPFAAVSADLPILISITRPPDIRWEQPASLKLQLAKIDLASLHKAIPQLAELDARGTIGGHIDLSGTLSSPRLDAKLIADDIAASSQSGGQRVTLRDLDACAALCYRPPGVAGTCSAGCSEQDTAAASDGLTASARIIWEGQPFAALEASAALPIAVWVRDFIERGALPTPDRDILSRQFNLFLDVNKLDLAVLRQRLNIPQLTQHDAEGIISLTAQGNGALNDPSVNLQLRVGEIRDVERDANNKVTRTETSGGFGWDRYRDIAISADGTLSRGVLRLSGLRLNWDAKDIFTGTIQLGSRARRLPTASALISKAIPDDVDIAFDLELVDTPVAKLSAVSYSFAQVRGEMGARLVGTGSLREPEVRGRAHLLGTELGRSKTNRRPVPADVCFDFKIDDNAVESSGFIQTWNTKERPPVHLLLPNPCERSMNYITQNDPASLARLKEAGVTDKEGLLARIAADGTRDLFEILADARVHTNLIAIAQGADPLDVPRRAPIPPRREFIQRVNSQISAVRAGKLPITEAERPRVVEVLKQRLLASIMRPTDDLRVHVYTELGQQIELAELIPRFALGSQLQDLAGRLLIDLDVQGSYKQINPTGFIALEDGTVTLPAYGRRFDKITMRLAADDKKLSLSQLSLEENRARLQLSGDVSHRWMRPTGLDLKAAVKDFDFGSFAGPPLFVSGDVTVGGLVERQRLDALVDVTNLNVRLPKSDKSLHSTVQSGDIVVIRPGQPVAQSPELAGLGVPAARGRSAIAALNATVRVKLAQNSWVRTEFGDVNFKGDVTAKLDDGALAMTGRVDMVKGEIEFLGKAFTVAPGNVSFNGTSPPDPALQIEAIHTLDRALIADIGQPTSGEPRIIVRVTGTAKKPELQLMSDPALSETDILYVLATGKPPGTAGVGQDESALGTALQAASGVFLGMLQKQLAGQVPVDVVRFQGSSSADSAGSIEVGKYITERLFVSYAHVFGTGEAEGANEVKVEYQFLPRWLLEVKYSDTNRGQINIFWDAY